MPPRPAHILGEDTLLASDAQQSSGGPAWYALTDHPTLLRVGPGALDALDALAHDDLPTLLVTTTRTPGRLGWTPPRGWHLFDRFSPNPTPAQVDDAGTCLRTTGARRVVVLGGGSAMDLGKVAALLADPAHPTEASCREALAAHTPLTRHVALIHVPTTSGTGAEVTPFASIWPPDAPKRSIDTPAALADAAWLDPALTATMPPDLTAITALDATVHAMEATLGVHTTTRARRLARHALTRIIPTLPAALASPRPTPHQRATLQLAATLAGAALALTRSAAAHALSYTLTAHHHTPHGLAVALLMRDLLPLQARLAPEAIAHILTSTGHATVPDLQAWFTRTLTLASLPTSLSDLGLTRADIERLAHDATRSVRLQNNPGPPGYEALVEALASPPGPLSRRPGEGGAW